MALNAAAPAAAATAPAAAARAPTAAAAAAAMAPAAAARAPTAAATAPTLSVIGKAIVPGGAIEITEDEYDGDVNPDYIDPLFDAKKGVYWAYFQMNEKFYKLYGMPNDTERGLLDKIKKIKNATQGASSTNTLRILLEKEKLDITERMIPRVENKINDLTKALNNTPAASIKHKNIVEEINHATSELKSYKTRLPEISQKVMRMRKNTLKGGRSRRNRRSRRSTRRSRRASGWW